MQIKVIDVLSVTNNLNNSYDNLDFLLIHKNMSMTIHGGCSEKKEDEHALSRDR